MTAPDEADTGDELRRAALASAWFAAADVARLDTHEVEDLGAGSEIEDALAAGKTLSEVARSTGYTEAVASDLLGKFRKFREILAVRDQIPLF
ncbi:urea amidohydrolase [Rhodococcus sp. 06-418-1B]|nr:urea amidohydrolase [Rhodococcus sp. 06-418-1B]OZC88077.1 urea amidohydrolase [Rhodococcus sp. 06-418-1B]